MHCLTGNIDLYKKVAAITAIAISVLILYYQQHHRLFLLDMTGSNISSATGQPTVRVNCSRGVFPPWLTDSDDDLDLSELPLQYSVDYLRKTGQPFNVSRDFLATLGHPPSQFLSLARYTVEQLSAPDKLWFAVAASSNHFAESLPTVSSLQHFYPRHTIVFIDVGLSAAEVQQVKTWCNVRYFRFDFSRYPPHVRNLFFYAWKVLAMLEILLEQPDRGLFYVDASARITSSNIHLLVGIALQSGGVAALFPGIETAVFPVTHPTTSHFLVSWVHGLQTHPQVQGGTLLFYLTQQLYTRFYWPLLLCLLTRDCIAPTDRLQCDQRRLAGRPDVYANCHRYDQAVISILLYNTYHFDGNCFGLRDIERILVIERGTDELKYQLKTC